MASVLAPFIRNIRQKWIETDSDGKMAWVFHSITLVSIFCVYLIFVGPNSEKVFGVLPADTNYFVLLAIGLIIGMGYHLKIWGELILLFFLLFMLFMSFVARGESIFSLAQVEDVTLAYMIVCTGVIINVLLTVVWRHNNSISRKQDKNKVKQSVGYSSNSTPW